MRFSITLVVLLASVSSLTAQPAEPAWKKQTAFNTGQLSPPVLALSPDGKALAVAGYQGPVKLWEAHTGRLRATIGQPRGQTVTANFAADGKTLTVVTQAGDVIIWDLARNKQQKSLRLGRVKLAGAAVSGDGKTLCTTTDDPRTVKSGRGTPLQLWDLETGKPGKALGGHLYPAYTLSFSADGKTLMSAGSRARTPADDLGPADSVNYVPEVKVWDLAGGSAVTLPLGGTCFSSSADTRTVVAALSDMRTARCRFEAWDTTTKKKLASFDPGNEVILSIALSPDGKLLASGGYGKVTRLWDAEQGKELTALSGHRGEIMKVAFSGDSTVLASSDMKGAVVVWTKSSR